MRRPRIWFRWLLVVGLVLVLGESVTLTRLAPRYVVLAIQYAAGGELAINQARLSFPFTTMLSGLRLVNNTADSSVSVQRMVIRPRWLSVPTRTLWVETLELERPVLRFTRTKTGTVRWPTLPTSVASAASDTVTPSWRTSIGSIKVEDGVIEFIDETPSSPFRGLLDHVSFVVGPVSIPFEKAQMSFAISAEVVGHGGAAAPLYCSGWLDLIRKDLEASCKLEPLALAAFDPYYQGRVQFRVYDGTIKFTSEWAAKSNDFEDSIQLGLENLSQADVSIRGTTVVDVKRLTAGREPRLSAQIKLAGPLDRPSAWFVSFVPGDDRVGQLVRPLLDRGIEMIKLPIGGRRIGVSLTPATQATITGIEATSKQIEEALEILAPPEIKAQPQATTTAPIEAASGEAGAATTPSEPSSPVLAPMKEENPPASVNSTSGTGVGPTAPPVPPQAPQGQGNSPASPSP